MSLCVFFFVFSVSSFDFFCFVDFLFIEETSFPDCFCNIIHLMYGREGNSPDVSRDEVERNIRTRGKTKLTGFLRGHTVSVLLYI